MLTQSDIASHLDLSERRVRDVLKALNLDHRVETLDTIRTAYIRDMRAKASGHLSGDGFDLTKERVLTERVDRELKLYNLAEKKEVLVNKDQLLPELQNGFTALKTSLLSLAVQVKSTVDIQYGIDLDLSIIETEVNNALSSLSRYDPCSSVDNEDIVSDSGATGEN